MVPDLPFFLGVPIPRMQTHGLLALLTWALPAGLVLYALFHFLLKDMLIALAPAAVQGRLAVAPRTSQPGWLAIIVSLLAGAATHIVWDSFTHSGTVVVLSLPVLQVSWGRIGAYDLYVFKVLQHLSSLVGLSLLAWWSWRWYHRTALCASPPPISPGLRWGICAMLLIAPLVAGAWAAWWSARDASRLADFIFTALPTFFWMLSAFALVWRIARRQLRSNAAEH